MNVKRNCGTCEYNGLKIQSMSLLSIPVLTANHLPSSKFALAQFHAHWGSNSKEGSEHFLDGKQLSGEVHFVFWNTSYESFNVALSKPDGLAVVGVFLKVCVRLGIEHLS